MNNYYFYKGRVALYALLKALGISSGDRVLVPGYTCVVVPSAIHYLGAIPEYIDIDSDSYNSLFEYYQTGYQRLAERNPVKKR
jgi:dTDP-4-amino-4,6-dideoxygalactose transaminase